MKYRCDGIVVLCYTILQVLCLPFFCCYLILRKFRGKPVFGAWRERCGWVPLSPPGVCVTWIHAVSVGEILSIQRLISTIKQKNSNNFVYVTTGTLQGKLIAQQQIGADAVSFLPYDFFLSIWIAFRRIKPQRLYIVEAEWWPSLLICARWAGVETYLLNARVSTRSRWYRKLYICFIRWFVQKFTMLLTATEEEKQRFVALGISVSKIKVIGNLKAYNVALKKNEMSKQLLMSDPLVHAQGILAGSVHPGEANLYFSMFKQVKELYPSSKLVLVPRHFHWQKELIEKAHTAGKNVFVWDSTVDDRIGYAAILSSDYDIVLVCVMGKLFSLYRYATVYCLGGTFVPIGGHNVLEPAIWGCPTIIGPYHQNIAYEVAQYMFYGAIKVAYDLPTFLKAIQLIFDDQQASRGAAHQMQVWVEGEAERVAQNILCL